ncbi:MAG: polysaccharide pyruvyl transferase family protein [Monoglobaceae bacterium]
MKLELCGYFDSNFGDDYMQKIVIHHMPEYDFYADKHCMISPLVLEESNVSIKETDEIRDLPKLMVTGSGFMVNSKQVLKYEILWFLTSKHIADYCIGCNIEPFKNKFSEWLIIQKLKKFKYIICRDKRSLDWLKKNCAKTESVYMPDILFSIPPSWLPEKTSDKKLGIALMHRSGDTIDNAYYKSMSEVADFWIQATGNDVVLMAFDTGLEDDLFACECVKSMMRHKDKAEIVGHGSHGEILNAYAKCSKIIGARFHSAVLAMKMNTDFYPIIYREKMRNLISDIQYPVKGCDISDIDTKSITEFLTHERVDFKIDKTYELQSENSFILLKNILKKN